MGLTRYEAVPVIRGHEVFPPGMKAMPFKENGMSTLFDFAFILKCPLVYMFIRELPSNANCMGFPRSGFRCGDGCGKTPLPRVDAPKTCQTEVSDQSDRP